MSVEKVTRASGVVWRVRWRDENGEAHSKVIGRQRDAQDFDAELRRLRRTGGLDLATQGTETLADLWTDFERLYLPRLARRSQRTYRSKWKNHIGPGLGRKQLRTLDLLKIEEFAAGLKPGAGAATTVSVLQSILQRGVEWGRIKSNPARLLRKANPKRQRTVRPLPEAEIARIAAALDSRGALLVNLMGFCGLRPSEALGLRWDDVGQNRLTVDEATDGLGGMKQPKTNQTRTVRLPAAVRAELLAYRIATESPSGPGDLIFPRPSGRPWSNSDYSNWTQKEFRPAAGAGVRPYDLRHTFVSRMISEGTNIIDIARQAGHSPTMTLDVYGHLFEEAADEGDSPDHRRTTEGDTR